MNKITLSIIAVAMFSFFSTQSIWGGQELGPKHTKCSSIGTPLAIQDFEGHLWTAEKIAKGQFGGFLIWAKYRPRKDYYSWSKEISTPVANSTLGSRVAEFFGYHDKNMLASFSTAAEANGRFVFYNKLLKNDKSHPAYFHYFYETPEDLLTKKSYSERL